MSLGIESKNITQILLTDGKWYAIQSIVIDAYEIGFYDKDYDSSIDQITEGHWFTNYQPEDCPTGFEAIFHNWNDEGAYSVEKISGPMSSILAIKTQEKEDDNSK